MNELDLASFISSFREKPYEFVNAIFPWGDEVLPDGSPNPLKDKTGPEEWQAALLKAVGEHVRRNGGRVRNGEETIPWRSAVASGHGVGKSALVAWLVLWIMSTRPNARGTVTAATQHQLEDKTWPELSKWHRLALNKHWFDWTATTFSFAPYEPARRKNYMITATTVSEQRTEAFAGLHNEGGAVLVIFDEASGVIPQVWEVAEGAMTDGEAFFFALGNPTRPHGEFYDCFSRHEALYYRQYVDSREVRHTNKVALSQIVDKYGVESDEVKVRVLGQFPTQTHDGFINRGDVDVAMGRQDQIRDHGAALVMAVDVARGGKDETVIGFRQGRVHRGLPFRRLQGLYNVEVARHIADLANQHKPDAIVIEATGPGGGVIDILRERGFYVTEVHPGGRASNPDRYLNKRAELWAKMRDWIISEAILPADGQLLKQLTSIQYSYDKSDQRIRMEPKDKMRSRGLPSPDWADMLALTFAAYVSRRDAGLVVTNGMFPSWINEAAKINMDKRCVILSDPYRDDGEQTNRDLFSGVSLMGF